MNFFISAVLITIIFTCFRPCNGAQNGQKAGDEDGAVVATVQVARAKVRLLTRGLTAYDKIIPAPLLMVETAENSLEAARLQLEKVMERLRMELAAAQELIKTEKEWITKRPLFRQAGIV